MLAKITILTSLSLAAIYPLCFWISAKEPLKQNFHHFHLGMPLVVGGVCLPFLLQRDLLPLTDTLLIIWIVVFAGVTLYYWKKESPNLIAVGAVVFLGIWTFCSVQVDLLGATVGFDENIVSLLAACILCASLYAMNLGHWYLNVHGLPIQHLSSACYILWILIVARILLNVSELFLGKVSYGGDQISLWSFTTKMDGFLLWIGVFFGLILPFISMFFVNEILKLKNTQATTGILYVILCSILIGDLTYKYYFLKFGVAL